MLKKFRFQLMILVGVLLLLPVLITGAMLYMVNHSKPAVLEEQRESLQVAVLELARTMPTDVAGLIEKHTSIDKPRTEQIKAMNRELAGAVMKVFQKHPGMELGYYSPQVKAVLVQMGQDSHLPYMDFKDLLLDVSEDTQWSEQAQWKDAFEKVIWTKKSLEIVLGSSGNQKLIIFQPLLNDQQVVAVIWAGERLGGINKEILQAESFAYTVIFFGFMLGLCSTFFLLKNYMDTVASIKNGLQKLKYDLNYKIPPAIGELDEISKAINELAARLVRVQNYNEIIMANIDAGIVAVDLQGRIVSISSSARKIFCLSEDAVEKPYHRVFTDPGIAKMFEACLQGKETKDMLITLGKDRNLQLLASTSVLLDAGQQLVGAVLSCRDITQRLRLEEQMRRQERLASLGQLVAGVAHEIKNPLTSISGYIQFWLKNKAPTVKSLNTIYREVRRLDSIVNKLLFFTKPTNAVLTQLNINSFISRVLNFFIETHVDDITFVALPKEGLPEVKLDSDQMEQVLMNIIYNAVQAMPQGGQVSVSTGYLDSEKMVYIDIQDTGSGIPEDILNQLFDPFFTNRAKGTGLGLTIADQIIRAHGGRIEISSKLGSGTRVRVLLPAEQE
ncbi:two-component system sensor histidine kinase AtoS [Desulforamulus aeronauticus]|uniref:histidine kinase n=1 Tax=Desulforamulus aeronauticus DSM 10349 TaxID=1121421 RepID=A0A1M6VRL8_9FIRM|nr:two-component system sensor histidine kinase AtoS [Desulforamulus aeronauticus]SHK84120.1 PAS/PAC sensor signal transduction histidine kinase [Desulforamulus aeronauticus DSM 10349]